VWLIVCSLFFYSYFKLAYLPLILGSIMMNYLIGRGLSKKELPAIISKGLLIAGISSNLALLGFFKYSDFYIENFNWILNTEVPLLHLALPLAISFFTFQQISFLVDSYRGEAAEYDLLNYTLFVSFFPQLIAGPIVHHKEMMPQFASTLNKVKNYKNISAGIFLFSIGLFKKVVLADSLSVWASYGFDKAHTLSFLSSWATSLSYTFQLYFDFSGYTDMALGAALLFNIRLPINFNSPYKAQNIQDFWRRWHITLSRFLRDYVYIPLGGNKNGSIRMHLNLLATFILGGIWHGAGWTFIFWGLLHGLAIVCHREWVRLGFKLNPFLSWFITFNFVNIAWIFFRANTWHDAIKILKPMASFRDIHLSSAIAQLNSFNYDNSLIGTLFYGSLLIISILLTVKCKNSSLLVKGFDKNFTSAFGTAALLCLSVIYMNSSSQFLYFNF